MGKRVCPLCKSKIKSFIPFRQRENAKCPDCGAVERHRALWLYFKYKAKIFSDREYTNGYKLLHFAPEAAFYTIFKSMKNIDYYPVDIDPTKTEIREIIDIQSINYQDEMFDIIICNHVLEHISCDYTAMNELHRVLKENGAAYITVPVFNIEKTIEDSSYNTPDLRLQHYGHKAHKRMYGKDFPHKLRSTGFLVEEINMIEGLTGDELYRYGLNTGGRQPLYKCTINMEIKNG